MRKPATPTFRRMSCFVANGIQTCLAIVRGMRRCLSPDPPEGGNPPDPPPSQPPPAEPPNPVPEPAPPPAAKTAMTGKKSEREIELEAELERERQAHATTAAEKKAREQRISELEDERRKLLEQPRPTPAPKKRKGVMERFFDGSED
jgi:hypothetical protein